jgi:16S rRNA (guanine527-N7)-methyltransferase
MDAALLRQRAQALAIDVAPPLADRLLDYLDLLWKWNRKINLTAITEPAAAIDRLLLEPVAAARHLPRGGSLADLGSGGGSPALPLALAMGASKLLMVESRSRKAAFLREAARVREVPAIVEAASFEAVREKPEYRGWANVISMRAVRPDPEVLSLANWLGSPSATIALFTSPEEAPTVSLDQGCSTWNITPSAMLLTFHVEQEQ